MDSAWIQEHVEHGADGFEVVSGKPGGAQLVLYSRPAMLQWRLVQTIPVYTLLSPVRRLDGRSSGLLYWAVMLGGTGVSVRKAHCPAFTTINQANETTGEGDFDTRIHLSFTEEYAHLAMASTIWLPGLRR